MQNVRFSVHPHLRYLGYTNKALVKSAFGVKLSEC